ncbi:Imm1 family immunity protein [Kitasatospora sp. NPDC056783]|uniref:Imm1 family immunity protein n=1 Tax=Kitasatospora sp. NPDC056783 TaxID=3345943 RepID=UPI0036BF39C9
MAVSAEIRYRATRAGRPEYLNSLEEGDALIEALLAGPANGNLAQIIHLGREEFKPGIPDHEFQVGVDKELQVGILLFIDSSGNYVSAGPPESRNSPEYYLCGHWTQFRDQTEIPLDLVRKALREFLESGGRRPACVSWKNQYLTNSDGVPG